MTAQLIQFSGVVIGQAHNPTVLNPDFLEKEGIVPKAWDWEVEESITTPPFAIVRYSSGVTITVESNKLQVTDTKVKDGLDNSKVEEITSAYVSVLRHVEYTASGNNFQFLIPRDTPNSFLSERFLTEGPWNDALQAVGVRLVYAIDFGRLTLAIDSGEVKLAEGEEQKEAIIVNVNFNRNSETNDRNEPVLEFLAKSKEDWSKCQQLLTYIQE